MDEGGKQLGALVIAIVVVVALIAIAKVIFGDSGILKTKITEELNKVTSYVEIVDNTHVAANPTEIILG